MQVLDKDFKEFILDAGLLSRKELEAVEREAEERDVSLTEILERKGVLSADELRRAKAFVLGVPFVNLKNERLVLSALSIIPEPLSRLHQTVVFRSTPETLGLAMLDVETLEAIKEILSERSERIMPHLTDSESMKHALLSYQKYLQGSYGEAIQQAAHTLKSLSAKITDATREETLRTHAKHDALANLTDN